MSDAPDIFPLLSYNRITERIILGSRPKTLGDIKKLRAENVSHILDVCEVDDTLVFANRYDSPAGLQPWTQTAGISDYLFNPTADDGQPKSPEWFYRSLRFAMPVLAQAAWVLYVHCESGIDRSAATVYAILRAFGLSKSQAWVMIKIARPEALWRYVDDADSALRDTW